MLTWAPGESERSLDALAAWVEERGRAGIEWYLHNKRPKAAWSRGLRVVAIAFATLGAALPFISALTDEVPLEWGYLAFACAGAALAFDRFFGSSSAWMRYLMAELSIQRILQKLRLDRTALRAARAARALTEDDVQAELAVLAAAAEAIHLVVEQETLAWVAEFQSNVTALNALAAGSKQTSPDKPG